MKRIYSRFKGMTKRCSYCPKWTPNRAGVCTMCLNLGVGERAAEPIVIAAKARVLSNREIDALDARGAEPEPAAVARGRGIRVPVSDQRGRPE